MSWWEASSTPIPCRADIGRGIGVAGPSHTSLGWLLLLAACLAAGCSQRDERVITIWHQSRPAEGDFLREEIKRFEAEQLAKGNPVRVQALYKETEELRSSFQSAALAGEGPELVYGPSDVLDTYHTMGILRDMGPIIADELPDDFVPGALTYLPSRTDPAKRELVQVGDRFGNHLALVYNRKFIDKPPTTIEELASLAAENTRDDNRDGRKERYGLVWNFTEPFFAIPFITGFGAWVFDDSQPATRPKPALDDPRAVEAYRFVKSLRDQGVVPANCDYELADALFKSGHAAMIINGDWSWADYLKNPDVAVAVLPTVAQTGEPMRPMVAPKGYSLNAKVRWEDASEEESQAAKDAIAFVLHMTSDDAQQRIVEKLRMLPARQVARNHPLFESDPTLQVSRAQVENGRLMPVEVELRAVWDAMRPQYQALLGGAISPDEAAARMQRDALKKIDDIHREIEPGKSALAVQLAGLAIVLGLVLWQRRSFVELLRDWPRNRLAYLFALPAVVVIFAVIVFPFCYNVVLSLSNMSLSRFTDWQVVGLQNYREVLTDPKIWSVFLKTIVWTVVNVVFHVGLGLLLAVALSGPVFGKALYRVLLIIPWAVPAYITALTWRGMFDYEYGAVNLLWTKVWNIPPVQWLIALWDAALARLPTSVSSSAPFQWLVRTFDFTPPVNWLGEEAHAFQACIVANVWLGFPFMMVIALGGMQGIPHELYEAARIDRASRWQQFRHITLPLLKPVLLPAVTLGTIWTFNNINVVWLVSNGGEPQDQTHILVSYVYKAVFNLYRYGYGAALSMIIFFLLLAFSLVFLSRSRATESVYG